ncbi:uncharacterized protein LOC128397804 [Panonychus citri]|uniref:uncharacterized protein LOC128397804 n=1 Tax=Panonychus citri TaxID=50023 RepID=UPI0023080D1F|nr:uncharacterized protein LOC128397804 [Panonychus citri]
MTRSSGFRSPLDQQSTLINISSSININCGVYWDIENVSVQCGQSADQFIKLIRDKVIRPKGLKEIEFICAYVRGRVTETIEGQIKSLGVTIDYVNDHPNAADLRLIQYIRRFVKLHGFGCNIILISGDTDFVKTLVRFQIHYKIKIYLIHCKNQRSDLLDVIADELYLINDGHLRLVTGSCDFAVIKVTLSPEVNYVSTIESDLKSMFEHQGAIKDCIYLDENDPKCPGIGVWIGFPSKELAKNVAHDKSNQPYHNHPLDVRYVQYPPSFIINKLQKYNVSTVREETFNILRILTPNSFSLARSSSIISTLSLPFKSKSIAYLIVTGFPNSYSQLQRRHHLSAILGKSYRSFSSAGDYVSLEVHHAYQAKHFTDKINNSNHNGLKLSVTISKELPKQTTITTATTVTRKPPQRPVKSAPKSRDTIVTEPTYYFRRPTVEPVATHLDHDNCHCCHYFKLICFILLIIFIIRLLIKIF